MHSRRLNLPYILTPFLIIFSFAVQVYAIDSTYQCAKSGLISSDKFLCKSICGSDCNKINTEKGKHKCDFNNYKGFVYHNNKTYALTVNKVKNTEPGLVTIENHNVNTILSKILIRYGINNAWIGLTDPTFSTAYNQINPSRFKWISGKPYIYSNWESGQPDNKFEGNDIVYPIYGEPYVIINREGKWSDVGDRGSVLDNYKSYYYGLIEFNTQLQCVSGTEDPKQDIKELAKVCDNTQDKCIACSVPYDDPSGLLNYSFKQCILSNIFDPNTGGLSDKQDYLCTYTSKKCIVSQSCPPANNKIIVDKDNNRCYYNINSQTNCSEGYRKNSLGNACIAEMKFNAKCPNGNNSCIFYNNDYYCNTDPCGDILDNTNYTNIDEPDNNVEDATKSDGSCEGIMTVFPGDKSECRLKSIKRPFASCCKNNNSYKVSYICKPTGNNYTSPSDCNNSCDTACDVDSNPPPDLVEDFFGIDLAACSPEEKQLAFKRSTFPSDGTCYKIKRKCTERWKLGIGNICVQERDYYCCFSTPLAKIVAIAARQQLGISWESCRGLTLDEFQKIDLDKVDWDLWIENYVLPVLGDSADKLTDRLSDTIGK